MNHVLNDLGETVFAEGAPGSIARARCEHPALIKSLAAICTAESTSSGLGRLDSAAAIAATLHGRGILTEMDSKSILLAAGFTEPNAREVWGQLHLMNQDHDRHMVSSVFPAPKGPSPEPEREPQR